MAKYHKVRQAFAILGVVGILATMTGCSQKIIDRAEILSNDIQTVCNVELEEQGSSIKLKDFELIGADVVKSSFDFDVSFNGVSSHTDDSVGFTSLTYEVPSSYFENVDKKASYDKLYDIFENIVKECEPVNVEVSPVPSISEINNAFIQNEVSPFEDYHVSSGLLYNLGTPEFDDASKSITFETKTLVELKSRKVQPGFGLGIGFGGGIGLGAGMFVNNKQGTFTLQDSYSITVDEATYESMKNDHSLVYKYCAEAIQNRDSSKISAERISTVGVSYDNADLLQKVTINELEKDVTE